jgi:hypothetical protein
MKVHQAQNPLVPYLTGWLLGSCLPGRDGRYLNIDDIQADGQSSFIAIFASGAKLRVQVTELPPTADKEF